MNDVISDMKADDTNDLRQIVLAIMKAARPENQMKEVSHFWNSWSFQYGVETMSYYFVVRY